MAFFASNMMYIDVVSHYCFEIELFIWLTDWLTDSLTEWINDQPI